MSPLPHENLSFLEPNHDHNPQFVVHLIELPKELLKILPANLVIMIEGVQDATSIAFSSKNRFDDLVDERCERLQPTLAISRRQSDVKENVDSTGAKSYGGMNAITTMDNQFSEPAFFHYQNQVKAEKNYLVQEALVDWHNKVHRLERHVSMLQLAAVDKQVFNSWLDLLKREVMKWEDHGVDTDIPDFESTIEELQAKQSDKYKRHSAQITGDLIQHMRTIIGSIPMSKQDSGIGMED